MCLSVSFAGQEVISMLIPFVISVRAVQRADSNSSVTCALKIHFNFLHCKQPLVAKLTSHALHDHTAAQSCSERWHQWTALVQTDACMHACHGGNGGGGCACQCPGWVCWNCGHWFYIDFTSIKRAINTIWWLLLLTGRSPASSKILVSFIGFQSSFNCTTENPNIYTTFLQFNPGIYSTQIFTYSDVPNSHILVSSAS